MSVSNTALTVLDERISAGPTVRELHLHSPAVGRDVGATLLTPPGWQPGSHGRYPVLYLLHGSSDDQTSWLRHTDVVRLAEDTGALVVMPEAGRLGFYTDWLVPDRAGTVPQWERFHLDELPALLETGYGASDVRMAAGISMGGYGALRYAVRRPAMFRAVASLSGLMHLTRPGMAALLGTLSVREGMRPGRVWGPRRLCAGNWAANDPYLQAASLRGTDVYLAAGNGRRIAGEEFVPGMGRVERYSRAMTEDLAVRLRSLEVPVSTDFTAGTHFWTTWRGMLDRLWPQVRKLLSA